MQLTTRWLCVFAMVQAETDAGGKHVFSRTLCSVLARLPRLAIDPSLAAAFIAACEGISKALDCLSGLTGNPQQMLTVRRQGGCVGRCVGAGVLLACTVPEDAWMPD